MTLGATVYGSVTVDTWAGFQRILLERWLPAVKQLCAWMCRNDSLCCQSISVYNIVTSGAAAACWNSSASWTSNSTELQASLKPPMQQQQQQKRAIACVTPMT